jgi:histidine triad (HIT) family protein
MTTADASSEPTVFTRIIRGEFPGRFVWRDEQVVAFLTIAPLRPGHVLVVPVEQVDQWTDLDPELWAELARVQLALGTALMAAFEPVRVGSIIAGLEVPHCHVHLVPIDSEADLNFANADGSPDPDALDDAAERIRAALRELGHPEVARA